MSYMYLDSMCLNTPGFYLELFIQVIPEKPQLESRCILTMESQSIIYTCIVFSLIIRWNTGGKLYLITKLGEICKFQQKSKWNYRKSTRNSSLKKIHPEFQLDKNNPAGNICIVHFIFYCLIYSSLSAKFQLDFF